MVGDGQEKLCEFSLGMFGRKNNDGIKFGESSGKVMSVFR